MQMTLAEVFRHVETLDGDPWPAAHKLAKHEWYGRDLMVYILAGLRGVAAFPLLLRAFARPWRSDDRDNFCAWPADIMETDPAACRPTMRSFIASGHRDLRSAGLWALGYVIQPSDVELLRQALAAPDPKIRRDALVALNSLKGDRRACELVLPAVNDRVETSHYAG
ncbi:HEAT repeat domain-containing protein [Dactylosporangium sp. CA-139114]|uniref:HEAT repeat domain-containing protein n=1 Tax=Dactylosporangium sp. CA-139114 TaxID=3239931 RepID=UPI003D984F06